MAKKSTGSSTRESQTTRNAERTWNSRIDFSDIPELTKSQLSRMKRVGRPLMGKSARMLIAIRIDPDVLKKLKRQSQRDGKGYQTLINEILSKHFKKSA